MRVTDDIVEKNVGINRVTTVVPGGRTFSFAALTVAANPKKRTIGYGYGKAKEVADAMRKASEQARKNMVYIPLTASGTIYHPIVFREGATKIMLKPAAEGTGIIAGAGMRAVLEVLGVQNIVAKCLGSPSKIGVVRATIKALTQIVTPNYAAEKRGKTVSEILGRVSKGGAHE